MKMESEKLNIKSDCNCNHIKGKNLSFNLYCLLCLKCKTILQENIGVASWGDGPSVTLYQPITSVNVVFVAC